jgi:hypothetical protein
MPSRLNRSIIYLTLALEAVVVLQGEQDQISRSKGISRQLVIQEEVS